MKKTLLLCLLLLTTIMLLAQDRVETVVQYHNENWTYYTMLPIGLTSERAERFTATANINELMAARFYLYNQVGAFTGVTCKVYTATTAATPMPDVLLGTVTIAPAAIQPYPNYTTIDLSGLHISFRAGEEFFISYSVEGGTYAAASPWGNLTGCGIFATGNVGSTRGVRNRRPNLESPYVWMQDPNYWDLGISAVVDYEISHDVALDNVNFYYTYTLPLNAEMPYDADVIGTVPVTETDVPVKIEIFNAVTNALVYTDTQIIPSLDNITPVNVVFNPYTYTAGGRYNVKVSTQLATDQIPDNNFFWFEQQVIADYPATITYDDGVSDGAWVLTDLVGSGFVSIFTPPYLPYKVTDVRYCLWGDTWPVPGGNEFRIIIYDDDGTGGVPGTELYNQVVTGVRGAWNTYDVSDANIVLQDGSFWVGYIFTQAGANSPGLATDSNLPYADQNVTYEWVIAPPDPPTLYLTGIANEDFMINATVAYPDPQNVSIFSTEEGKWIEWGFINGVSNYEVKSGMTPSTITQHEVFTEGTGWLDASPASAHKFYNVTANYGRAIDAPKLKTAKLPAAPVISGGTIATPLHYYLEINN